MADFDTALAAVVIGGYLLGSIPFGLLLTRCAGLGDIRAIGSGNIGATNVLRTGNKSLALLTLLLDGGKGAVAVLIARHFTPGLEPVAGICALLGHIFPLWLKFKGGKGVATTLGILVAAAWPIGVIALLVWLAIAALFRYSSLGALISIGSAPVAAVLMDRRDVLYVSVIMTMLVVWKHKANIQRLLNGTEPRIGHKASDAAPTA